MDSKTQVTSDDSASDFLGEDFWDNVLLGDNPAVLRADSGVIIILSYGFESLPTVPMDFESLDACLPHA